MTSGTPDFFRVSKKDKPLQKLTGITTAKQIAGSAKKKLSPGIPDIPLPPEAELLAPSAQPIPGRAEDEAKKKVKRRGRGRAGTIKAGGLLASRLNQRRSILKTRLG